MNCSLQTFFSAVFILFLSISSLKAQEQSSSLEASPLLDSPRKAAHTFVHWQQTGHENFDRVIKTFQLSDAETEEKKEFASQLLRVLDARGLMVVYENIPSNPAYEDTLIGLNQYILFDSLPEVYLVKSGANWVFSKETINQIPSLYRATISSWVEATVEKLPEWAQKDWIGFKLWQYLAIFLWILVGFIFMKIFTFVLDNYVRKLAERTPFEWDDVLLNEIEKPISYIFLLFFFSLTYTNLQLPVNINFFLSRFLDLAISFAFVWLAYNLSNVVSMYLSVLTSKTETTLDDQLVPLIRKTLRVFVVAMGIILVLQNNGFNVASLIAGLGIGGLAVALAARETLANFFGSVTIFIDKPFRIGDWIKVGSVEGTVEEVGFRSTRIRTFYNSLVSVPNSVIANTDIDNLGMRKYRRLKTVLNLTYSTSPQQMEAFVEGIKAIVQANPHFRQDFFEVHFNEFGAHSLDVLVYVFFKVPDWSTELQQRHNFLLEVLRLAKEVGVEFAFPTQTLHVDSFYKDSPRKVGEEKTEEELANEIFEFGIDGKKGIPQGLHIFKDGKAVDIKPTK